MGYFLKLSVKIYLYFAIIEELRFFSKVAKAEV